LDNTKGGTTNTNSDTNNNWIPEWLSDIDPTDFF